MLLWTFSIGLSVSCAGLKPFPTKDVFEYDAKLKVCRQYVITDAEHFKFEYVKNIACISIFGFSSKDIPKVLDWGQDSQEYAKAHCN